MLYYSSVTIHPHRPEVQEAAFSHLNRHLFREPSLAFVSRRRPSSLGRGLMEIPMVSSIARWVQNCGEYSTSWLPLGSLESFVKVRRNKVEGTLQYGHFGAVPLLHASTRLPIAGLTRSPLLMLDD